MSIGQHHLQKAVQIIEAYKGKEPLALFVKNQLAANKKHGSKDRRNISDAVFAFFRLGGTVKHWQKADAVAVGLFLTRSEIGIWQTVIPTVLQDAIANSIPEKLALVQQHFPFFESENWVEVVHLLTNEIRVQEFCQQLLIQPPTFLRIRKNKLAQVQKALTTTPISFTQISDTCLAVAANTQLQSVLAINQQVVVQDWASQQVASMFELLPAKYKTTPIHIWDVCAASGGKTLLAIDYFQQATLFATDVRAQILKNYAQRMQEAGFKNYQMLTADVSAGNTAITNRKFDLVMADVPCSGSGTWARSPEQLTLCTAEQIEQYAQLQRKIAVNSLRSIRSGGYFLYITCSVFACENEENVQFLLQENKALQLIRQSYFNLPQPQSDTLFAALFSFQ